MSRKNLFILFFIIIVGAAILYIGFTKNSGPASQNQLSTSTSPNQLSTSTFPNYLPISAFQNQLLKYGIEFTYPAKWIVTDSEDSKVQLRFTLQGLSTVSQKSISVIFQLFKSSPHKIIEERSCDEIYDGNKKDCVEEYFQVDGTKAIRKTYKPLQREGFMARDIGFVKDGKYFHFFSLSLPPEESVQALATQKFDIDNIVSTFKFISQ